MATLYATHADALRKAKNEGPQRGTLRGTDALADLVLVTTSYDTTGEEVAGDVIKLTAPLPEALVLVPALSVVAVESDPGTTLTVNVGTAENASQYASSLSLSTTGKKDLGTARVTTLPESEEITATISGASGLNSSGKITFYLAFRAVS